MEQREILAKRSNKVVYREGNLVYKVFDCSFPKADILNEALNQARIEETGLPIPGIVSVNVTEQGEWTIVQEYVSGKTMAQLMKEEPENRNQYLEQFVDLQLLVHSKRSPLLNKLREKLDRQISTCEALSPNTRFIIRGRLDSMQKHACVLHGDFNPGNIIVSEDGTCHILDWSHATQGNASADAANTYLLLTLEDAETADQYLELYCRKSKTAKHYVQQWLSIAAASRKTKGIPEEEKLLNHWLNVLEYE
ncbi:phosphotransferase family protein [Hungatella sp.]|uniref:phosphotransferase family protein n=1 Tax=Hungatella sp. TaxID=2613924 RepID=UPI003AB85D1C